MLAVVMLAESSQESELFKTVFKYLSQTKDINLKIVFLTFIGIVYLVEYCDKILNVVGIIFSGATPT